MKLPKIPHPWLLFGPLASLGVGLALNVLAVAVNGAQMPVLYTGGCAAWKDRQDAIAALGGTDSIHTCMTQATHLKLLCDWIVINGLGTFSIGDGFIEIFYATWLYALVIWAVLRIKDHHDRQTQ